MLDILVMETYQEPIASWLINENALNVLLKNATTGIVFKCHPNSSLYCVPIDLCINALIASTYDTAHIQENLKVYNLGTNHPKLSEIFKWYISENVKNPWLIFGSLKYRFLCHMKDLVLEMSGKRGIYVKEMEVLERFIEITREFAYKELYCHSENLDVLWNGLNQSERELLFFNLKEIDFEKYVKGWFKLNKDNLLNPLDICSNTTFFIVRSGTMAENSPSHLLQGLRNTVTENL
ncbi:PREDICTED: uncharacterized protein LOC108567367 [Nicrophorus vespilloides]|uniref:Uncharacterized protein LOC108567367 n=1 Tax=Nicrophorus vespilloides TaxID=110193 RepID=A0ABM1N8X1_NICVS|nr:PREDICTED: uncharacterized protein LOC108567367 [Nicrophorus vespilloides]